MAIGIDVGSRFLKIRIGILRTLPDPEAIVGM
jgi:hypothetical protein